MLLLLALFSCARKDAQATDVVVGPGGGDDSVVATDDSTLETPPVEMRGVWVTRWTFSNAEQVESIMAELGDNGFNAVFFQVRGTFDAYYDSSHEPWAARLAGLGTDPGWDPLAVAVEAGHANGLQVHAYINTFPMWSGTSAPSSTSIPHAYEDHSDWLLDGMELNSSYVFADPAEAGVQARVAAVAADIEAKYAVDGIHLDYVRYPGPQYADADAGRKAVKDTVAGVQSAVDVPVTAAVWGIYENSYGWSGVSQGNVDYYQDSWAMAAEGLTDALIPMIYWSVKPTEGERLDFRVLVRDHVAHKGEGALYAGIGADSLSKDEVLECVRVARSEGADGVVLFDYTNVQAYLGELKAVFAE